MSLRAVIVEDEENGLINLKAKLKKYCPQVEVVAGCSTPAEGIQAITDLKPDLVFLDIGLGPMTGFDMLDKLPFIDFHLVITTAYKDYAPEAFKANAVDYLLKPISHKELTTSVTKVLRKRSSQNDRPNLIAIPVSDGFRMVSLEEILYVKGNDQRSTFKLFNGQTIDSPRLLKQVSGKLLPFGFHRIHKSYLVNLQYIQSFSKKDGGYVTMTNGDRLKVSKEFEASAFIKL